jgi:hypothetical protein
MAIYQSRIQFFIIEIMMKHGIIEKSEKESDLKALEIKYAKTFKAFLIACKGYDPEGASRNEDFNRLCTHDNFVTYLESEKIITLEKSLELKTEPLRITEYTKESEVLIKSTPEIKQIFFALKKQFPNSKGWYLKMINDLCRIQQYHETEPDKCIKFVDSQYPPVWAISAAFISALERIIDNDSTFIQLLQSDIKYNIYNKKTKSEFLLTIDEKHFQMETEKEDEVFIHWELSEMFEKRHTHPELYKIYETIRDFIVEKGEVIFQPMIIINKLRFIVGTYSEMPDSRFLELKNNYLNKTGHYITNPQKFEETGRILVECLKRLITDKNCKFWWLFEQDEGLRSKLHSPIQDAFSRKLDEAHIQFAPKQGISEQTLIAPLQQIYNHNNMDFSTIIIAGYNYALNYRLPSCIDNSLLTSHFKREARKAQEQYFEYNEFFRGCNNVISEWKNNISNQLLSEQNNKNSLINLIKRNGYKDSDTGQIITDPQKIEENIQYLKTERDSFNIDDFTIEIDKTVGKTIPKETSIFERNKENECSLKYNQLEIIGQAIQQVETELIQTSQVQTIKPPKSNTNEMNTGKPQRTIDSKRLKDYFKLSFYNKQNQDEVDYFSEYLLLDIDKLSSAKEASALATLIFHSTHFRNHKTKPMKFGAWLKIFFELIEMDYVNYKESALKELCKARASTYHYLPQNTITK